jgi:hypothetical protein
MFGESIGEKDMTFEIKQSIKEAYAKLDQLKEYL